MVNVFFRAVLEKVCSDNKVKLVKKKRRRVLGNNFSDVDSFVESVLEKFDFGDMDVVKLSSDIRNCHKENSKYSKSLQTGKNAKSSKSLRQ